MYTLEKRLELLSRYLLSHFPDGWHVLEGATTAPMGYVWVANGEFMFSPKRRFGLVRQELVPREKEPKA